MERPIKSGLGRSQTVGRGRGADFCTEVVRPVQKQRVAGGEKTARHQSLLSIESSHPGADPAAMAQCRATSPLQPKYSATPQRDLTGAFDKTGKVSHAAKTGEHPQST